MNTASNKVETPKRQTANGLSEIKLDVRNFGPIVKGRLDVRPLTVFAGPSNTGKSWIATLVYVLSRHKANLMHMISHHPQSPFVRALGEKHRKELPNSIARWMESAKNDKKPIRLLDRETKIIHDMFQNASANLLSNILHYYGSTDPSDLIRDSFKGDSSVSFSLGDLKCKIEIASNSGKERKLNPNKGGLQYMLPKGVTINPSEDIKADIIELNKLTSAPTIGDVSAMDYSVLSYDMLLYKIIGLVVREIIKDSSKDILDQVHYFPADRTGIMHSRNVVASALIKKASTAGLPREHQSPVLSGVIGDFLEKIIAIEDGRMPTKGQGKVFADSIEEKILNGKIIPEKTESGYLNFHYQPKGWKGENLPLTRTSSMVSELLPIILLLRHTVVSGDTLILEEPEAHLHPAAQKQFIEEIASWTKKGVNVVLTTHSEWILEGLSNITARAESKTKPVTDQISLNKEDVGIWLFNHTDPSNPSKGSEINEVIWDADDCGYKTDFYDTAMALHNDWARFINQQNDDERAGE